MGLPRPHDLRGWLRRVAPLLALAALLLVAGRVARPVACVVAPSLAVKASIKADLGRAPLHQQDPWGAPYRWLFIDAHGLLHVPDADPVEPDPTRRRFVDPGTYGTGPWESALYSDGPNGVDEHTLGDDVVIDFAEVERDPIVHLFAASEAAGETLAALILWVAAALHATTRPRRVAAFLAWVALVGQALRYVEWRWGLAHALSPVVPDTLLLSPGCAAFLSLAFAGALFIAWASNGGRACAPLLPDAELREDAVEDVVGRDGAGQLAEGLERGLEVDRGQLGPGRVGPAEQRGGA